MDEGTKVNIFSTSLFKGLVYLSVGILAGMGLVTGIRGLMGLQAWSAEPAWVVGALVGGITFMIGTGVISDWWKWAIGDT
jgi:hypothetical protein